MSRTEIRELAFKLIYSLEMQDEKNLQEQIDIYLEDNNITDNKATEYIQDIIYGINKNDQEISKIIN